MRHAGPSCSTILFTGLQEIIRCGVRSQQIIVLSTDNAALLWNSDSRHARRLRWLYVLLTVQMLTMHISCIPGRLSHD